ncbi:hypothetical protein [Alkaliphilus peptidifermentans]|uniref:Uncharacterized protein n=1 Tax=Alkaliphilus peptidifermentans DSM 18978 TaxID=1120976 RepID=A0A1G5CKX7_9FIRM|nr:hypothetical protein [Alkaliphilus peptidifermentans]SCY03046.1 hypothetical protein SAMN03080606_00694 [Alkaliphilus peptidifermentans DSM 18978]
MLIKSYEIKRGNLFYREDKEFISIFQEIRWILKMRLKGFKVKKL